MRLDEMAAFFGSGSWNVAGTDFYLVPAVGLNGAPRTGADPTLSPHLHHMALENFNPQVQDTAFLGLLQFPTCFIHQAGGN